MSDYEGRKEIGREVSNRWLVDWLPVADSSELLSFNSQMLETFFDKIFCQLSNVFSMTNIRLVEHFWTLDNWLV